MKRTLCRGVVLLCVSSLMLLSAGIVQARSSRTIELNFSNFYSSTHLVTKVFEKWAAEVEKRTDGQVKITFFNGSSLAKMPAVYDMVRTGSVEIGSFIPTYQTAIFPVSSAVNIPFMFKGPRQGGAAMWTFYQSSPEMKAEYAKVKPIMMFTGDIKNIHTANKSVKTLKDLKGVRIGCGAGLDVKVINTLGATPVQNKSLSETYLALEKGTVDGIYYPWAILKSLKMTDLLSYHTIANMAVVPVSVIMNLNKWKSLPPDVQKVFEDLSHSVSALCGVTLEDYSKTIADEERARDEEIYVLPVAERAKWIKAVKPIENGWRDMVKKKGLNPDNIIGELKKATAKYEKAKYPADSWWKK
ncbi:MAG: TRAP transporter substrate-binding protein [Desulfohalobiaceae bacterium]|nr:TRAP transporter substrate-binding protein [Desulfohalobiaceae bacterium]